MDFSPRGPADGLTGRRAECCALGALIEAVRAGQSRVLVVHGEPGVGKSALLDCLAGRAAAVGCRVLRVSGVQSEMELAFAGVHQLCAQLLGRLDALPGPQRQALATAFGMSEGPAPDRFLVGLAVLGLLSEVAGDPTGDPVLIWRAAAQLGIGTQSAAPAAAAGLAEFGARVRFRHPLVRSAVYQSASEPDRQEAHRVLAEATDPHADPDRRAWHRAHSLSTRRR